jgi:gas vesicle protein
MSEVQNDVLVARNNTFVAESDLDAAASAINLCFEKEMSKLQDTLTDEEAARHYLQLLSACRDSLLSHIERVVEPVSDEAFFQFVNNEDPSELEHLHLKSKKQGKQSVSINNDPRYEFDVEDLIDEQASVRAKELRKSARDEARQLQDLRIAVIDRATSLAKRQVDLLITKHPKNKSAPIENVSSAHMQKVSNEADAKLNEIREQVSVLCSSLQKHARNAVASSVSSLDETVSNVRRGLEIPANSSKTSQAIFERNSNSANLEQIHTSDRLVQYLGQ